MNPAAVDPASVRDQLARMLKSEAFANAGRLRRLLEFTVERTLDGRGDTLKEYVLGVEVFERDSEYDPRLDSIVRVEARRLRSRVAEYYRGPGASDLVLVQFRKGSYVPVFQWRSPDGAADAVPPLEEEPPLLPADTLLDGHAEVQPMQRRWPTLRQPFTVLVLLAAIAGVVAVWRVAGRDTAAASSRISVAVLPLAHYDGLERDEALADAVTDRLTGELARYPALGVTSRTTAMQYRNRRGAVRAIAAELGVVALVEGAVSREADRLRLHLRIVDPALDRKVWVDELEGPLTDRQEIERRAASALAAALLERFPVER
ncbi:MAG TPA: hypothetical protein VIL35_04305 [Vicinamibacterales bacterium]